MARPIRPLQAAWLRRVWLLLTLLVGATAALAAPALQVDGRDAIDAWPAVEVWADADPGFDVTRVQAERHRFIAPTGTAGNLGRSTRTLWLRLALQVPGDVPLQRVLEIDYPPLNRVDLYMLERGRVSAHHAMGSSLARADRAEPARGHAARLDLAPGEHELLIRVDTQSSMVLPITLRTPASFTAYESQVQIVQGIALGLTLCMLMYSLAHGASLRDRVFIDYALMLAGNIVFSLAYYGIGAQYLWPQAPALSTHLAPLGVLVAVAFGTHFSRATLAVREISPAIDSVLRVTGVAALLVLAGSVLGILEYRTTQGLVTVLGLIATIVVLPIAYVRVRRGERVAGYMLVGWVAYVIGAMAMTGILRGLVAPSFWVQHVYPFSLLIEMFAWMAVLGVRVQSIHRSADRARIETDAMRTLAHTDALTGLPNRRGLQMRMELALERNTPDHLTAVYLLDLDGFKPVNDRWGHDIGDALLIAVGRRLQSQLRTSDTVARLGGDEFVVLASGLAGEQAAQLLAQKLLAAFQAPFDANGQPCQVGLTVGYALSPQDGLSAIELLKRADTAMYAGKQAGRGRAQRGGRSLASA
ncbi:MAG: diguanylate cyclase [Burkholderiaceae bacterium]